MDGTRMTLMPQMQELVDKFNEKVAEDEKLREEIKGMDKKVFIDLESEKYNFRLQDQRIDGIEEGEVPDPDITISSDPETMQGILDGTIKPMKAFALRKVRFKGNIDDLLRLRKLF
jgi:putative sterol carrier protein